MRVAPRRTDRPPLMGGGAGRFLVPPQWGRTTAAAGKRGGWARAGRGGRGRIKAPINPTIMPHYQRPEWRAGPGWADASLWKNRCFATTGGGAPRAGRTEGLLGDGEDQARPQRESRSKGLGPSRTSLALPHEFLFTPSGHFPPFFTRHPPARPGRRLYDLLLCKYDRRNIVGTVRPGWARLGPDAPGPRPVLYDEFPFLVVES